MTVSNGTKNPKLPLPSVTSGLPMSANFDVYGKAFCCSFTVRPALPVPVSWPASVVPVPQVAGFGLAARLKPERLLLRRERPVTAERRALLVLRDEAVVVLREGRQPGERPAVAVLAFVPEPASVGPVVEPYRFDVPVLEEVGGAGAVRVDLSGQRRRRLRDARGAARASPSAWSRRRLRAPRWRTRPSVRPPGCVVSSSASPCLWCPPPSTTTGDAQSRGGRSIPRRRARR